MPVEALVYSSITSVSIFTKIFTLLLFSDPWQDLKDNYGKGGYEKLVGMRSANPHLKVLIAIGGWNEGSERYSNMAANPERRQAFVKNALEFVKYDFHS